jgi:hypothetical protein
VVPLPRSQPEGPVEAGRMGVCHRIEAIAPAPFGKNL